MPLVPARGSRTKGVALHAPRPSPGGTGRGRLPRLRGPTTLRRLWGLLPAGLSCGGDWASRPLFAVLARLVARGVPAPGRRPHRDAPPFGRKMSGSCPRGDRTSVQVLCGSSPDLQRFRPGYGELPGSQTQGRALSLIRPRRGAPVPWGRCGGGAPAPRRSPHLSSPIIPPCISGVTGEGFGVFSTKTLNCERIVVTATGAPACATLGFP
jgi:hypothetical protein